MRNLTPEERAIIADPAGHWFFATLQVEDADLQWKDAGALAIGSDGLREDFFNSATWNAHIDQNTPIMSAVLRRDVGNNSLSPYRSDSPANARTDGTFGPVLDIHRHWRVLGCVMPRGAVPDITSYRELESGRLDLIDIQDDYQGQGGTITIQGRGMEQNVIDSYVMTPGRVYGNATASVDAEDVIQAMLDDQMGIDEVPLLVPTSPGFGVAEFTQAEGSLMPQVTEVATIAASVLRYRHDSADVNRFTLIIPNRNPETPDWAIGSGEWRKYTGIRIDKGGIRNYIKAKYPDATFGSVQTVVSPPAEPGTVTAAAGVATFSASQAGVLAVGAIIVVNDRPYKVLTFDGTTGATLSGQATFAASSWHTSASITRYGLRPLLIDFTIKAQVTSQASAGNIVDALRSDLEDPAVERAIDVDGLWFVQLYDYVQLNPDGKNFNEVTYGGVTSITQTYANGMLRGIIGLRGKPSGGYRRWLSLGSGAPRAPLLPTILSASGTFVEWVAPMTPDTFGIRVIATVDDLTKSLKWERSTTADFAVVDQTLYSNAASPNAPGMVNGHFFEIPDAGRLTTYFVRITPYSGVLSGGVNTGIAGLPWVVTVGTDQLRPTMPQFDQLDADLSDLTEEPFTLHDVHSLPNGRIWADRPAATIDLSVAGEIGVLVEGGTAVPGAAASTRYVPAFEMWRDTVRLATIPLAITEIDAGALRKRLNLAGATSLRLTGNIHTAAAGAKILIGYTTVLVNPVFGDFTWLSKSLSLADLDARVSQDMLVPPGMAADVIVSYATEGGNDVVTAELRALGFEVSSTDYVPPLDTSGNDPFDPPDGPLVLDGNPWDIYGERFIFGGGDVEKIGGQLRIRAGCDGTSQPLGVWQALPNEDGVWETSGHKAIYNLHYEQMHIWIANAAETVAAVFGPGLDASGPGGSWDIGLRLDTTTLGRTYREVHNEWIPSGNVDMLMRYERAGGDMKFWYNRGGAGWVLATTLSVASAFPAGVPTKIGIGHNPPTPNTEPSNPNYSYWDYFERIA